MNGEQEDIGNSLRLCSMSLVRAIATCVNDLWGGLCSALYDPFIQASSRLLHSLPCYYFALHFETNGFSTGSFYLSLLLPLAARSHLLLSVRVVLLSRAVVPSPAIGKSAKTFNYSLAQQLTMFYSSSIRILGNDRLLLKLSLSLSLSLPSSRCLENQRRESLAANIVIIADSQLLQVKRKHCRTLDQQLSGEWCVVAV